MTKKIAYHPEPSVASGPYSPALSIGEHVYIAGQGPISPETKQVAGDSFEEQMGLTFSNVENALRAAGCTLNDCVKVTVYLSDMANYDRFNTIYKTKFIEPYPTRTTVQAVLWHHIQIEIDVIAIRGSGGGA